MQIRFRRCALVAALALSVVVAACGGGGSSPDATAVSKGMSEQQDAAAPATKTTIAVPNSTKFSFDLSYVDSGKYFLADRSNAAVDVVDTSTNTLVKQIKGGFFGIGPTPDRSGPASIVGIPGSGILYVGDVNSIKIIDANAGQVLQILQISNTGNRVDAGCYDPDDHLMMFASPAESPPFVTFISTQNQTIVAKQTFQTSTGLEACVYDGRSKSFIINNDGTPANPDGEVDVIPVSSVLAGAPSVGKVFPLGACAPTGLALGPHNDMIVGCDPSAGNPLITLILNRSSGEILATIPFGGVDQIAYDPVTNRYLLPARHYTASGIASDTSFVPTLGTIDASSRTLVAQLAIGNNAHSIGIDSASGQAYLPFAPGVAAFPNGGIQVVTTGAGAASNSDKNKGD